MAASYVVDTTQSSHACLRPVAIGTVQLKDAFIEPITAETSSAPFTLCLRVPAWAENAVVTVNKGAAQKAEAGKPFASRFPCPSVRWSRTRMSVMRTGGSPCFAARSCTARRPWITGRRMFATSLFPQMRNFSRFRTRICQKSPRCPAPLRLSRPPRIVYTVCAQAYRPRRKWRT